MAVPYL